MFLPVLQSPARALTRLQEQELARMKQEQQFVKPSPKPSVNKPNQTKTLLTNILTAAAGSLGAIGGAALAWMALHKKNQTFDQYQERLREIEKMLPKRGIESQTLSLEQQKNVERELLELQEEVELSAAKSKITTEQLNALSKQIERRTLLLK